MKLENIGRYEIKQELGRGGMATVYQAFDPRFRREVAIKVLPREFLHDASFRARFEREAQTIAALEHPAIVPVYDFGEEDGQPYIVMRLMTGGSLNDRLRQGPLSLGEAARLYAILAPALDEAHSRGVIHRDLKPGNILFDQRGDPYLSDFGIAKLTEASAAFTGSAVLGTPAYMSPEQAKGERNIDGRSDLYALGALLFQLLTGQMPYEADTPMGVVVKHIVDPVPRILETNPTLPVACHELISRAMAKDKTERFSTAGEMAGVLANIAFGAEGVALPAVNPTGGSPTSAYNRPATLPPSLAGRTGSSPTATRPEAAAATGQAVTPPPTGAATGPQSTPALTVAPAARPGLPLWVWVIGGLGLLGLVAGLVYGSGILAAPPEPSATPSATPSVTLTSPPNTPAPAVATATVALAAAPTATVAPPPTATEGPAPTPTYPPPPAISDTPLPDNVGQQVLSVTIHAIVVSNDRYLVEYTTQGYDPALNSIHIHFFFNNVTPEQAGVPGQGPWFLYGGPNPFTGYRLVDRPASATAICALVANHDHTVRLGTGNCVALP